MRNKVLVAFWKSLAREATDNEWSFFLMIGVRVAISKSSMISTWLPRSTFNMFFHDFGMRFGVIWMTRFYEKLDRFPVDEKRCPGTRKRRPRDPKAPMEERGFAEAPGPMLPFKYIYIYIYIYI